MPEFDPLRLSRELGALLPRVERGLAALTKGNLDAAPFGTKVWPGKATYDQVAELDATDPLRVALLRWVNWFVESRVQWPWLVHEARLIRVERHVVREPRDAELSLAELTRQAVLSRGAERAAFLGSRRPHQARLGAHRAEALGRSTEIARRLGLTSANELLGPLEARTDLVGLAWRALDATEDASRALGTVDFTRMLAGLLAEEASEGLPARLAPDVLLGLWGGPSWLRGVQLPPFALPARWAPSSYVLAFERLGGAWYDAQFTRELPLVVAVDPARLWARREGAVFAAWWRQEAFLARRLGLGRERCRRSARAFGISGMLEMRRRAARVLLRDAGLQSREGLDTLAYQLSVRLFGEEMGGDGLLGLLGLGSTTDGDFVACLTGAARDDELRQQYDVDYFDDPRVQERLRDEARRVPSWRPAQLELESGLAHWVAGLEQLF